MIKVDSGKQKRALLVLSDSLSSRIFLSCGIVKGLKEKLKGNLDVLATFDLTTARNLWNFDYVRWTTPDDIKIFQEAALCSTRQCTKEEMRRLAVDRFLDKYIGYFPMTMRFNLSHGFMKERMTWGNKNPYLNLWEGWPFSGSRFIYFKMFSWYFGESRFFHPAIAEYMTRNTSALITANLQFKSTQPYVITAHRLGLPIAGNIASWDHPVGKGIVFPQCSKYIVQNEYMREVLEKYHNTTRERIIVTGWPQSDLFAVKTPKTEYIKILNSYGLNPELPCILIAGNSASNAPYEPNFVKRFIDHWQGNGGTQRYSIIFRPHPKDGNWKERYLGIANRPGLYIQAASYSDTDVLTTLLQHVDCVITNAGTILLDSLVNNRPAVCVLYDEGGPRGSRYAINNITGHHYQEMMNSGAFYSAYCFEEVIKSVEKSLCDPSELKAKRTSCCARIIGTMDGRASSRVVEAILSVVGS
jgi:hypothetical protein